MRSIWKGFLSNAAEEQRRHTPKILVPYPGPEPDPTTLDVFVYLRPETNGVAVESTILKVIRECKRENVDIDLIYLANVPGDHIVTRRIVERHYALRLFFAVHGGAVFNAEMRGQFASFYGVPFECDRVIGAFEALRRFAWEPEELFRLWVAEDAVTRIAGQVIKRYDGVWIVNYDIPALLHKNNTGTDIAVMTFRTRAGYPYFFELAGRMRQQLVEGNLLRRDVPIARAVHISRSPFEQLLDSRDYLLGREGTHLGIEASSFATFLHEKGIDRAIIEGLVEHPICRFDFNLGEHSVQSLLDLCEGFSYLDGWHMLQRIESQEMLPGRSFDAV